MSKHEFVLTAEVRGEDMQGKGASRRLRHEKKVPAVIYGAGKDAQPITLNHNELWRNLLEEAFYSQIITVNFGSRKEQVILRDLQRHPAKPLVLHADLQRIRANEALTVVIPLHFINEETSIGVKEQGGAVNYTMNDVEVSCLPKDLPEYIEVDLQNIEVGQVVHLSELTVPEGVTLTALEHGEEHDLTVASIYMPAVYQEEDTEAPEEPGDATDEAEGGDD